MNSTTRVQYDPSHESTTTAALFFPLVCVSLLALFTVTAPTSRLSDTYGTRSILPDAVIVGGKTLTRAITVVTMCGILPFIWHRPRRATVLMLALPWFAFGAWGILSTTWSPIARISLGQSGGFCCLLLVSFVIGILCNGIGDISYILRWLSGLLAFIAASLIFLHFAMPDVKALTKWALGIFHATNACATSSLAIAILLCARLIWNFSWARRCWVPGILLHTAVLAIGVSRTSIGVGFVMASLICMLYGNRLLLLLAGTAMTIAVFTYLVFDPNLYLLTSSAESTGTFLSQGQNASELATFTGRTAMWQVMWKSFLESPWLGHGYFITSSTGEIYVWHEWGNWTAHNIVLQLLVTTGVIGAGFFALGLLSIGFGLLRRALINPQTKNCVAFCFLIAMWHALWGMLDSSILGAISPEGCVFSCVLGIAFSVAAKPVDDPERGQHDDSSSPAQSDADVARLVEV